MQLLLISFIASLIACLLIIRYSHLHAHLTDDNSSGPQKVHKGYVPRVGGIGIFFGLVFAILIRSFISQVPYGDWVELLLCALPVVGIGLLEDITKKIGVKLRLFFTGISVLLASYFMYALVIHTASPLDYVLAIPFLAYAFTCFAVTGVANSYNIIDGFNGLASMVCMITLTSIGYIAFSIGDTLISSLALMMIGAVAGFFLWNYPRGLIFLGDGGAYLIGYWVGILSVLLVTRNPLVSPWFALLVNAYPITETVFTIWRRSIRGGKNPGLPDAAHFHSLIYRRVIRWAEPGSNRVVKDTKMKNAMTSPYLWLLSSIGVIPATLFWHNTLILKISAVLFVLLYLWAYRSVVRFKKYSPKT